MHFLWAHTCDGGAINLLKVDAFIIHTVPKLDANGKPELQEGQPMLFAFVSAIIGPHAHDMVPLQNPVQAASIINGYIKQIERKVAEINGSVVSATPEEVRKILK